MKRLLIATTNPGKIREYSEFLSSLPVQIISLKDVGITDDIEEDGKTFAKNSLKKAVFYAKKSGLPSISDDGGIEISALHNEPGVHTKRWLGYEMTDEQLIEHLTKVAKELPDDNRIAVFKIVLTFALPNGKYYQTTGEVHGIIAKKPHMKLLAGYPFRSFFYLPKIGKYFHESELTQDEQKEYNHRYKAVQTIIPVIRKELGLLKD